MGTSMNFMSEKPLGIPMELAESRRGSVAQSRWSINNLLRRCLTTTILAIWLFVFGLALVIIFFAFGIQKKEIHTSDSTIIISTGERLPNKLTHSETDMTVFIDIKNRTGIPLKRKRRDTKIKTRTYMKNQINNDSDFRKARKIIMDYNFPCDPENTNEFCKQILRDLNVIDENGNTKNGKRSSRHKTPKFKLMNNLDLPKPHSENNLFTEKEATINEHIYREGRSTTIMDKLMLPDVSENDRSSHFSDSETRRIQSPIHTIDPQYRQFVPPHDCPLTRLFNQQNFPTGSNYFGDQSNPYFSNYNYNPYGYHGDNPTGYYGPYTPTSLSSPYSYFKISGYYPTSRDVPSAFDRNIHPQDVAISIHYKTTESPPPVPKSNTFQVSLCPEDSWSCVSVNSCIEKKQWCDGIVNCEDASDETNCTCKSRVGSDKLCDGYSDCPFGEDEMGCFGCEDNEFSCDDFTEANPISTCFKKEQRCNNAFDCPNRKDEAECNLLAPSLHEKPAFAVSHTQGYLHRNFKGKWYPVCENPYMWAHDACRREAGLLLRPPVVQFVRVDPTFRGQYINGDFFRMSQSCFNSSAIYVNCQDLLCGTRVQTTTLKLREDEDIRIAWLRRHRRAIFNSIHSNKSIDQTNNNPHSESEPDIYNEFIKENKTTKGDFMNTESNGIKRSDFSNSVPEINIVFKENRTKRGTDFFNLGRNKRVIESRVVGGVKSQPAAWPWMVVIYRNGRFHCGGVVINKRWILTAAHCVTTFWEHYYEVQVGVLRRLSYSPQEQNHLVTHIIINSQYRRKDMVNDLALLRVTPSIQYSRWVRPICMPGPETAGNNWKWGPKEGTICTAVGWGATVENANHDPDHMREVEVPIWAKCNHKEDLIGNEICAGLARGGKDSCQGDSGGPLLCKNPGNPKQWYLAGIVSHGIGCAREGEPGVYVRVSLYIDWIFYNLAQALPILKPKHDCPGFKCTSGISKCLPKSSECDSKIDCLDGEDEKNCNFLRTSYMSTKSSHIPTYIHHKNVIKSHNTESDHTHVNFDASSITTVTTTTTSAVSQYQKNMTQEISKATNNTTPENDHLRDQSSKHLFINNADPQVSDSSNKSTFSSDTDDLFSDKRLVMPNTENNNNNEIIETTTKDPQKEITNREISTTDNNLYDDDFDMEPEILIKKKVTKIKSKVLAAMAENKFELPFKASMENKVTSESNEDRSDGITEDPSMSRENNETAIFNVTDSENSDDNDKITHDQSQFSSLNNKTNANAEIPFSSIGNNNISLEINNNTSNQNKLQNFNKTQISTQISINNVTSNITAENIPIKLNISENIHTDHHNFSTNINDQISNNEVIDADTAEQKDLPLHDLDTSLTFITEKTETTPIPENSERPIKQFDDKGQENKTLNTNDDAGQQKELPVHDDHSESTSTPIQPVTTPVPVHEELTIQKLPERVNTSKSLPLDSKGNSSEHENSKILPFISPSVHPATVKKDTFFPSFFACKSMQQVIRYSLRCNHIADCEDGTDEEDCTCADYIATLNPNMLCNGIVDCADGSDESNCYTCNEDQFLCRWSKMCIPFEFVCDGKPHCSQGEDEIDCYALSNGQYMSFDADNRPLVYLDGFLTRRRHNSWEVVCEDHIDVEQQDAAANNICIYLGFRGSNNYNIMHINVKDENEIKKSTSKRAINKTITFIHQFRQENDNDDKIIQRKISNPVLLPYHCVPNVTKTCMTLHVSCDATLISEAANQKLIPLLLGPEKISNELMGDKSDNYLWPWAAKMYIEGRYRCTGVLLDLSWVIISESCLWDTLLHKNYVTIILGSKQTLLTTNGPFEQILEVDGKENIYESHALLIHLTKPATYSRMVKPMVISSVNMHRTDNQECVTLGQDEKNHTVTVLLKELSSECPPKKRCFVRQTPGKTCLPSENSEQPWAGIISCRGESGWFPAASYVEPKGECGFLGNFEAHSLAHARSEVKSIITSKSLDSLSISKPPPCFGTRCLRGACISLSRTCDGVRDCEDGRDEVEDACEKKLQYCSIDPYDSGCGCKSGELKCHNGRCISKQLFADGKDDCGDNSDEPRKATCSQYLSRVAPNRLCDGKVHCFDRSDEDPTYCKCFSERTFGCYKSKTCVAKDMVCDGIKDCPHGEDENYCTALSGHENGPNGVGEVIVQRHGVWHTKCYLKANHTRSELENICRSVGYYNGHAALFGRSIKPKFNPNTNVLLDPFRDVALNDQTIIKLRNNDEPIARAVVDETAEKCYPIHIECI